MEEITFTRINPKTGERQERTVDTPRDVVQLQFDGWDQVGGENKPAKKAAPRKAVKKATGAPPARELNDTV